mmetsp:Transcript_83041/g.231048  ORF Transcript_83041/g.231048 Transcript_83041/m.231048 type:complete len:224 (+) Transcript_83041:108-779(+)
MVRAITATLLLRVCATARARQALYARFCCCRPLYTSRAGRTRLRSAEAKCTSVTGGTASSVRPRCTPPGSSRRTSRKACCARRATSSPDMPPVCPASSAKSPAESSARWPSRAAPATKVSRRSRRCSSVGRPTSTKSPKRRSAASSIASARFVAPTKKMRSVPRSKPSIQVNKAFVTPLWCSATPAPPSLLPKSVSTSSKKTMAGLRSCESASKAAMRFCESP